MSLGLDLGSTRFRALRRVDGRLFARQVPTAYTAIEGTPAQDRLLSQAHVSVVHVDNARVVVGGDAEPIAAALGRPLIPLLPEAELPPADPLARQVVAELLESVLEGQSPGTCSVVLPRDAGPDVPLHDFLVRMLKFKQIDARVITAPQAVCLAELGRNEFAGVVLCLGATATSLSLIEHGEVLISCSVPCGTDWIDERIAQQLRMMSFGPDGRRYLDFAAVRSWKHAPRRSLQPTEAEGEPVLSQAYVEILTALLARFGRAVLREGANGPRRAPLPVVCQGGGTQISGFLPLLERLWSQARIQLLTQPARLCADDNWTVARGCLIHAELGLASSVAKAA